ncbi:MAG: hypothetical protein O7F71_16035 [Gammaproteobacteria bacterium]|nr:hypothetical protein [Gammaproteobacteria bacterium]
MEKALGLLVIGGFLFQPYLAVAEDVIGCVDPDIVHKLLGNPGEGSIQISREWPKRFPPVAVPNGFVLIGSRMSSHLSMISFKSSSSVDDARAGLELAMTDAEWQQPEYTRPTVTGGFQSSRAGSIRNATSFCHDDHGHMSAMFSEAPGEATYITLMGSTQRSPGRCSLMQRMMSSPFTGSEALPQARQIRLGLSRK